MEEKLLTVIVPVYNVEKYIHRCVDSILAQTYKNLQIILVDDGSPDNCGAICDEYTKKDSRVMAVHQENGGASSARNNGLLFAKGEYVTFVDSDDWIETQMYERLMGLIQKHDLDMVRCSALETDGDAYHKELLPNKNLTNILIQGNSIFYLYFSEFLCKVVWNAVYHKEIVKNIFFPEGYQFEDNYVSGRYLYRSKRMMITSDILYNYWVNPHGISRSQKIRLLDACLCTEKLKEDLLQEGLQNQECIHSLNKKLARELFHYIRGNRDEYKVQAIEKVQKKFIEQNLDFFRALRFNLLLWKKHIHIY